MKPVFRTMTEAEVSALLEDQRVRTLDEQARWKFMHEILSKLEAAGMGPQGLRPHAEGRIGSCPHCQAIRGKE